MPNEVENLAKIIWEYMLLHSPLSPADVINVLGSIDARVAEHGVKLWKEGLAPLMLFSGTGLGHESDLLASDFGGMTEADYFASIARKSGVPDHVILIENKSTDTGKNAQYGFRLLTEKGIPVQKIIVVTKPYMERRAYATFKKQWPDQACNIVVTSPPIPFEEYFTPEQPFEKIVNLMIGDLQRIKLYPALNLQIPQEIPDEVWQAYEKLVALGYTKHLIKE